MHNIYCINFKIEKLWNINSDIEIFKKQETLINLKSENAILSNINIPNFAHGVSLEFISDNNLGFKIEKTKSKIKHDNIKDRTKRKNVFIILKLKKIPKKSKEKLVIEKEK